MTVPRFEPDGQARATQGVAGPDDLATTDAAQRADDAVRNILRAQYAGVPVLIVPSPPGAGKTDLVEKVAAQEAGLRGRRCLVVTQTNQQAFELVARMRRDFPSVPIVLYCRARLPIPESLARGAHLRVVEDPKHLPPGPCVVVSNATKLSDSAVPSGTFDLTIVDEAWQLPNYLFLTLAGLATRLLLVGDPGQIAPVVRADVSRWSGDLAGPQVAAPQALLVTHPDSPRIGLPVSRRLVDDTAHIIQRTFYPDLPFTALVRAEERRLEFRALAATEPADAVLGLVSSGRTLSLAELPPAAPTLGDGRIATAVAHLVHRTIQRGAHVVTPRGVTPLDAARIGVVCAHRAQVRAVRARLAPQVAPHVLVETANRFQGLERDLVIAWHPLAGRATIRDFHVDAGRFCVMLSRHRAACIVVGRSGMGEALERYAPAEPPPLGIPTDAEYEGWAAHHAMLEALGRDGRTASLPEPSGPA